MADPGVQHQPSDDIPLIVVLADDDRDTLDMYAASMETAGLWVAPVTSPEDALDAIDDLSPDLVVTDVAFSGGQEGVALVHAIKEEPATAGIPVIVLTGRDRGDLPAQICDEADLVLTKPVSPSVLVTRLRGLLERARALPSKSSKVHEKTARLLEKSARLQADSARLNPLVAEQLDVKSRPCPSCGGRLEWLERGQIAGIEYDYYRWCSNGCGLYCCERRGRAARTWVKLA